MTPTLPGDFLRLPIAHRALHDVRAGRPENSRAAVRAAVARRYAIEIDVQPSADGVAMVFHDDRLDRLTQETGPIRARSAEALGRIALTGASEGIPTLAEVLALVAGKVPLLVEVKDQDGELGPKVGALEAAVARDLAGYGGPVAVMSFNPHSVAAMAEAAPALPRGLTTMNWEIEEARAIPEDRRAELAAIADFDRVGACFISHHWRDLAAAPVVALKARGVPVLCWTIRSPAEETQARERADNITFEGYLARPPA
ncbi:glycerophosphodiester phosphodiesterase family protein [Maritimibacter sp. HL-12]|uniref:glycerophosphodiester phosphodiesterase family protein n=1 Tax=Maritimibacter sp. HL-12 TaxID=1162418 RepID=UPI000A0F2D9E|nr:glycerophosphodiester phosphodiesterase family protein [Maritimibacter sp. HL-12]SMH47868.1 Glycerophosphoryl diester phosphodiesterase [Maritimibacter sp. HL-12]